MRRIFFRVIGVIFLISIILYLSFNILTRYRYKQAVERGVDWLISNANDLPPGDVIVYLKSIYKVSANANLEAKLIPAIVQIRTKIQPESMEVKVTADGKANWEEQIYLAVDAINRNKCMGMEVSRETQVIRDILSLNRDTLFRVDAPIVRKMYAKYMLEQIGIDGEAFIGDAKCSNSLTDINNLYCITHQVIISTDYYSSYLNPSDYKNELNLLRSALLVKNNLIEDDISLDVTAQMVASLKLLKRPDSILINQIKREIASRQNDDGGWGEGSDNNIRSHVTTMAILSLVEFDSNLKKDKLFCY